MRLENIALNKSATQSSTYSGLDTNAAYLGNDGNLNTRSVTKYNHDPWWEVDLGRSVTIKLIRVHLVRYALDRDRYDKLKISTRNNANGSWLVCEYVEKPTKLLIETNCIKKTTARHVRVSVGIYTTLFLYEVEIFV